LKRVFSFSRSGVTKVGTEKKLILPLFSLDSIPIFSQQKTGEHGRGVVRGRRGGAGPAWDLLGRVCYVSFVFIHFLGFSPLARGDSDEKQNENVLSPHSFSLFFPFPHSPNERQLLLRSFEDVERTSVYANYLALRWF
jgi:hypothetical protein